MMNENNRLPLYVQAKNYILERIESGEYPVDSQLPTEKDFMQLLGIGRATVRTALSELEREGRVVKRHGVGTFVAPPQQTYPLEPLISLSYSLDRAGMPLKNLTIDSEYIHPFGKLLEHWDKEQKIGHLRRLRLTGGTAIALEDSYFIDEIFPEIERLDKQDSVAHALLGFPGVNIMRVDYSIHVRQPSAEEQQLLHVAKGHRVVGLMRWTFSESAPKPISFLHFVVDEKMIQAPFQLL